MNLRDLLIRALCINPMDFQQNKRSKAERKVSLKSVAHARIVDIAQNKLKQDPYQAPLQGEKTTQFLIVIVKPIISFIVYHAVVVINNMWEIPKEL